MAGEFEADLDPETRAPRIRFNFSNGWTASIVLRMSADPCVALAASVACFPTGKVARGLTELGETEATAGEVAAYLMEIRGREDVGA